MRDVDDGEQVLQAEPTMQIVKDNRDVRLGSRYCTSHFLTYNI